MANGSAFVGWFDRLPPWGRAIVVIAVATAIATWLILTWLPNPLMGALADHITDSHAQTKLLRRICENTSRTPYEAGRCGAEAP